MDNQTQPKVSIIVPVYNVEQYLPQCIESIINQDFNENEIILIDDGSNDKSGKICDEYAEKDSRIFVIHKSNGGLSDARNHGLAAASGRYIMFVDGDDFWSDKFNLESLIKEFESNPQYDFLLFNHIMYFQSDELYKYNIPFEASGFYENGKIKKLKELQNRGIFPMSAWNKIIKKDFLSTNKINFIKGIIAEDIPWFIELLNNCNDFGILNEYIYVYRKQVPNAITNSFSIKKFDDLFQITKMISEKYKDKSDDLSKIILSYMAFELSILIGSSYKLKNIERKSALRELKHFKWLFNYDSNLKVRKVKNLLDVCGFSITSFLLHKYITIVVNRNQ